MRIVIGKDDYCKALERENRSLEEKLERATRKVKRLEDKVLRLKEFIGDVDNLTKVISTFAMDWPSQELLDKLEDYGG